jgi:hypothetical protein
MDHGPSGKGVEDFYGPEINSIPVPLPQFAGCGVVPFADPTPDDGRTNSFDDIKCYDMLHVQAVANQIDGYNRDRTEKVGVPARQRSMECAVKRYWQGRRRLKRRVATHPKRAGSAQGTPSESQAGPIAPKDVATDAKD